VFVLSNFILAITTILDYILVIANWLIIIRALLSWVSPDPYNPVVRFLYAATEPILAPFRRLVPIYNIGIDLSPILALLLIWFLRLFLIKTLVGFAIGIR